MLKDPPKDLDVHQGANALQMAPIYKPITTFDVIQEPALELVDFV